MAKVNALVVGGQINEFRGDTVRQIRDQLSKKAGMDFSSYIAMVNNAPARDDQVLRDGQMVTFSENVKGA